VIAESYDIEPARNSSQNENTQYYTRHIADIGVHEKLNFHDIEARPFGHLRIATNSIDASSQHGIVQK